MDYFNQTDQLDSSRRRKSSDDNLIPLINIVFLLLVFFMVTGQIRMQDGTDIQLPMAELVDGGSPPIVDVQLDRRNEIFLDGKPVNLIQLEDALAKPKYALAEHLVLKADRQVLAENLGALLQVLRASGITNIRLLTQNSGS